MATNRKKNAASSKATVPFVPEVKECHTLEVVFQGDPGKFINMLLALPSVKSINLERE